MKRNEFSKTSHENASDILFHNIKSGYKDKVAIYCDGKQTTYGELAEMANQSGNLFKHLHLKPKSLILLLLHDKPTFPAVFFGGVKAGYIMAIANTNFNTQEIKNIIQNSEIETVVVEANLFHKIKPIRDECPHLKDIIVIGGEVENTHSYEKLLSACDGKLESVLSKGTDPAFIIYTSGSTGFPKAVVHKHQDLRVAHETFGVNILKIQPDDVVFSTSKLFFAYGFGNSLSLPYGSGSGTVLLTLGPTPSNVFDHIEKYKPTLFFTTPSFYNAMLHTEGFEKRDLSSIRLCISAGEMLPPTIYHKWKNTYGIEIIDGIGCTEILNNFISNVPGNVKLGSLGKVVPGYEAKLVNKEEKEVAVGESGVLMVKGGTSSPFYWNNPEKTAFTMRGDWIYTNDRFKQDEEGNFFFEGRDDDMFKVTGLWVSPSEIEHVLMEHQAIKECLVSGQLDSAGLVEILAQVVLRDNHEPSEEMTKDILKFIKLKIALYKQPKKIVYVDELPKTSTGKKKRMQKI